MPVKVNLLPKDDFESKPLGKFLQWMLSYGRYIIISVELIVLVVFFSRFIFDRKLADLSDSIEQKKAIIASAADLEKNMITFQKDLKRVSDLDKNRDTYLALINRLKVITPKDTFYEKIGFNNEKITLSGKTLNSTSFAYFLAKLRQESNLSEIDLTKVTKNNETGFIEFSSTAIIKSIKEINDKEAALLKKATTTNTGDKTNGID